MNESIYQGGCFCGAVRLEVRGDPILAGYCHCQNCRDWSNTPMTSFVMWPYAAVTISQGKEDIALFARIPETPRAWCARCGGHIGAFRDKYDPPHIVVGPHMLSTYPFKPAMHLFCGEAVIAINDDLPKFRDLPKSIIKPGTTIEGSGELMSDPALP